MLSRKRLIPLALDHGGRVNELCARELVVTVLGPARVEIAVVCTFEAIVFTRGKRPAAIDNYRDLDHQR